MHKWLTFYMYEIKESKSTTLFYLQITPINLPSNLPV